VVPDCPCRQSVNGSNEEADRQEQRNEILARGDPQDQELMEVLESNWENDYQPMDSLGARVLKAFWTLSTQRMAVRSRAEHPPRYVARRLARNEIPVQDIHVITLRRPSAGSEAEPSAVDWSHRWLVGGHWRNQFLPSVGSHRLQWISPYVKGPSDKPLIVKSRLYKWTR
jgi:hypothetical protein